MTVARPDFQHGGQRIAGQELREIRIAPPQQPHVRAGVGERQVDDAHVAAHVLGLLQVPEGQRVVVAVREQDGVLG